MRATDFRPNSIFKMEGHIWQVVTYEYVQNDRRRFIRVRIKNLDTGVVQEQRFNGTENFEDAELEFGEYQFSYDAGNYYVFMDSEWNEVNVPKELAADAMRFHTDGTSYTISKIEGKFISVTPPTFVVLEVTETDRAVAGDTARNAMKTAKLESGFEVKVPMFVNTGDKVRIDTRDGSYCERA